MSPSPKSTSSALHLESIDSMRSGVEETGEGLEVDWRWTEGGLMWTESVLHKDLWGSVIYRILVCYQMYRMHRSAGDMGREMILTVGVVEVPETKPFHFISMCLL
jgi:hypothetical protein